MEYRVKKDPINQIPKAQFIFWLIVRISFIVCIIYSIVQGDYIMMGESIACFLFSHLWDFFQVFGGESFIIEVPPLSQTMLNAIIFAGIPFGSYLGLFDSLWWYDIFMHILSGFVSAVCIAFCYSIRPLSFRRISISVPSTFLSKIFTNSFSISESLTSVIGFLSIA